MASGRGCAGSKIYFLWIGIYSEKWSYFTLCSGWLSISLLGELDLHGNYKRAIMRGWTLGLGNCRVIGEEDCVAIFHSIHRVMAAEKVLKAQRLDVLLIPVPRLLSSECGMAIRYSHSIHPEILAALVESKVVVQEVWVKRDGKYRRIA
ncbi:MAG: DUF3343 domain-containing protein [Desulfuromusa sp.]|jgi:hypothetical protein|nr:DUF3343 domain-containing protein [Desulfuromusa sp.]